MNFEQAFTQLLGHEGGYVNHPSDPGGETNWGVTKRVAQENGYQGSMRDFTKDDAMAIYDRMYWIKISADNLPDAVRFDAFDAAVNSGVGQAIKWLQRAVGVADDGVIGQQTLNAIAAANGDVVAKRFNGQRLMFMTNLSTWQTFGKGWARRIAHNLMS